MMFSVCLISFIFIMTASFTGMPISGTHTVVGALIGVGMVGSSSAKDLNWIKLFYILVSWLISPTISMIISFILMTLVSSLTMNTKSLSFKFRIYSMQFITGFCSSALIYLLDQLFNKKFELNSPSII